MLKSWSVNLQLMTELTGRALANGTMLPGLAYTSPDWFELERPTVHDRRWTYVCHASELERGSFRRVRIGTEDMVITRDKAGELHALHNVCRHRGAEVVVEECGAARSLVCPYHLWSYDLAGHLKVAHGMPDGLALEDFALKSRPVREWHGLVFVLPDVDALDSSDFVPVPKHPSVLERYRMEEAKVAHTEVYDIAANWKAIRENFLECYHCSTNHPQFTTAFDLRAQYDEEGRQTDDFPLKNGMCSLSMDGQPVSKRPFGDFVDVPPEQWAYTFVAAAPDFVLIANPDHVVVFGYTAAAVDRTVLKCDWLVHRDAVEGVDYETKNVVAVWHETNLQDIALCESAQRGMRSSSFESGPLSQLTEPDILDFHRRYEAWLRDGALETSG